MKLLQVAYISLLEVLRNMQGITPGVNYPWCVLPLVQGIAVCTNIRIFDATASTPATTVLLLYAISTGTDSTPALFHSLRMLYRVAGFFRVLGFCRYVVDDKLITGTGTFS